MENLALDPSDLIIREATQSDIVSIIRLLSDDFLGSKRESLEVPLKQSYLEAFEKIQSDPNSLLMVATLESKVVGTFQLNFITNLSFQGSTVAQVESVQVASDCRGRKIGETMMRWVIQEARARNCHRIQLSSSKQRKDAHRFYQRLGFEASHEGMKLYLN